MKRTAWLGTLRDRLLGLKTKSRRRRQSRPSSTENLEDRTLLSAATILRGNELTVFADGDEDITVRSNPFGTGDVEVVIDGVVNSDMASIDADQLASLHIIGGPGSSVIDLTGIRAADFTFTDPDTGEGLQILVEAGDGDDTILSTFDFNDTIFGGDGNDRINNTPMLPGAVFTMPPTLMSSLMGSVPATSFRAEPPLRIINGTETMQFESVGLLTDAAGTVSGVGTLISPRHVLTSASLVDGLAATDGRIDLEGEIFSSQEIIIHPNFDGTLLGTDAANDIAVVVLDTQVTNVTPSPVFRDDPVVGDLLTLVGFGEGGDGTMGADMMPGMKRFGDSPIDLVSGTLLIRDFDSDTEANTAPGDEGAPGFITENGQMFVAGVFSTNTMPTAVLGDRAFDTRVDNYAEWIDSIVAVVFPPNPLGNLTIDGGDGDDTINGGDGNDSLSGGDGNDTLLPWFGDDTVLGGDGNDFVDAERGDDVIILGHGEDSALGGDGNDTINGGDGSDTLVGENGDDSLLGGGGNDFLRGDGGTRLTVAGNDTILGNSGDDTIAGGGGLDVLNGGAGDDLMDSGDQVITIEDIDVSPEGDVNEINQAVFTLTLSRPSVIPVVVDVATVDAEAVAGLDYVGFAGTVTFAPGELTQTVIIDVLGDDIPELDERFVLELSNPENALLGDTAGVATIIDDRDGPTQIVFLDFDSGTDPFFEHFYTPAERDAIQARLEADYGAFNYQFTQVRPFFGQFTTILFNELPLPLPGLIGIAIDGIDFRNLNQNDTVFVDAAVALNILGAPLSAQNFIAASANVAAHELGHAVGLRHGDAFGPIGQGVIPAIAPLFNPPYPGPVAANETNNHIMSTPAIGQPLIDILDDAFFGAREAIKLSQFSFSGQVTPENIGAPHDTIATAQIITLADLPVPNLEESGPLVGLEFEVASNVVTGSLNATGESDFYAVDLQLGENLYIEVVSDILTSLSVPRYVNTINSLVNVFDEDGNLIPYFNSVATNDDEWEGTLDSLIIDLIAPATGRFYIEVTSSSGLDIGSYELFTYTFDASRPIDLSGEVDSFPLSQVTMIGGGGNDTLSGSNGDDLIVGGSGADSLMGNPGDDTLLGGSGADTIQGNDGDDNVLGQGGDDLLEGNAGDDLLNGGGGNDVVYGDSIPVPVDPNSTDPPPVPVGGNDTINGGARNDSLFGGVGDDLIFGGSGRDVINGDEGNDRLFGQGGADTVNGGAGDDDIIWRRDGNDLVDGGEGRDNVEVRGTNGTDRFLINQDVTTLQITEGNATLRIERDQAVVANSTEAVTINARSGHDRITIESIDNVGALHILVDAGAGNDIVTGAGARTGNVRLIIDGGSGDDHLTGTGDADSILGGDGTDQIFGRSGDDTLRGGDDADTIDGQAGNDLLLGEERNDLLIGGNGNDTADGSSGNDTLDGGMGDDSLRGALGRDVVNGMDGDDILTGDDGEDIVIGGNGNDTIHGGESNDTLDGQFGDDSIFGDDGDDHINGGEGEDSIDAGDGRDTVMGGSGNDFIAGNDGDDLINGQGGTDTIAGGDGDDSMQGGGGNDILLGGLGNDGLSGNGGSDTIDAGEGTDHINNPEARDRIFDNGNEFALTAALRELLGLVS